MAGLVSQRIAVMWCSAVEMFSRRVRSPGGRQSVSGPISSSRRLLIRQRPHWPGWGWLGSLQVGQLRQVGGAVQSAQSGSAMVPETIARWRPQAEHAANRRWQAGHQGWPVAREVPHGVVAAQIEQVRTGTWGTPSTAARAGFAVRPGGGARSSGRSAGSPGR